MKIDFSAHLPKNNKEAVEQSLAEINMTIAEAKDWLNHLESMAASKQADIDQAEYASDQDIVDAERAADFLSFKAKNPNATITDWFNRPCNKTKQYDPCMDAPAVEEVCNVAFFPETRTEDTSVYVGETPVYGISRARLEYDSELGTPVLHLEILNPSVGTFAYECSGPGCVCGV